MSQVPTQHQLFSGLPCALPLRGCLPGACANVGAAKLFELTAESPGPDSPPNPQKVAPKEACACSPCVRTCSCTKEESARARPACGGRDVLRSSRDQPASTYRG